MCGVLKQWITYSNENEQTIGIYNMDKSYIIMIKNKKQYAVYIKHDSIYLK